MRKKNNKEHYKIFYPSNKSAEDSGKLLGIIKAFQKNKGSK